MGEFVSDQPAAGMAEWCVGSGGEHEVAPNGVGEGPNRLRGYSGLRVSVQADISKVGPEARFEERAEAGINRLSERTKHLVHNRWRFATGYRRARRFSVQRVHLFLALGAFPAGQRGSWAECGCGIAHAHHVFGDLVGLALERIVDRTDRQLRLQSHWRGRQTP
jgi:hypothetical protein